MPKKTSILILGTVHGLHKENPNYGYEHVFSLVESFQPDVVGVEIRPEDMDQPSAYLSRSYPFEMIEAIRRYGERMSVVGFDWLGHDLNGHLIPEGYWQRSRVKQLEKEFEESPSMALARELLGICDDVRLEIIRNFPSAAELNDGRYEAVSRVYYQQLAILTRGTPFNELADFYDARDNRIADNISTIVKAHTGKRLAFLMGIDHRDRTVRALREQYGDAVELVGVLSL